MSSPRAGCSGILHALTRPRKVSGLPIFRPQTSKYSSAHISTGRMNLANGKRQQSPNTRHETIFSPRTKNAPDFRETKRAETCVQPAIFRARAIYTEVPSRAYTPGSTTHFSSIHSGDVVPPTEATRVVPTLLPHAITATTTSMALALDDSPHA